MSRNERWKVPMADLRAGLDAQHSELLAAVARVMQSGSFVDGPDVAAFEDELAAFLGVESGIGVNSGTDALVIGLRALGVVPGDEVIVPAFSFVATAEAVSSVGAKPVFVDIDPRTFNMQAADIEAVLTPRTRAIVPVHLYGLAAAMAPILARAAKYGLFVLEDAAQALGGTYRGRRLGSLGDAAAFSFFPTKILGAFGDGGLLATSRGEVRDRARRLRQHGGEDKYDSQEHGYNSRLDSIQAAVLRVKLRSATRALELRRAAAARYAALLDGVLDLEPPFASPDAEHAFQQYTIRLPPDRRAAVRQYMAERGVQTMVYYPKPLHLLPVYSRAAARPLPHAEAAARSVLSLPLWPEIQPSQQETVVAALREALSHCV